MFGEQRVMVVVVDDISCDDGMVFVVGVNVISYGFGYFDLSQLSVVVICNKRPHAHTTFKTHTQHKVFFMFFFGLM